MPKDYANTKKNKSKKSKQEPAQGKRPRWLLALTVVVTIAFASGLVLLKLNHNKHVAKMGVGAPVVEHSDQYVRPLPQQQSNDVSTKASDDTKAQSMATTSNKTTEPSFEFYSTLTQKETPPSPATQQIPVAQQPAPQPTATATAKPNNKPQMTQPQKKSAKTALPTTSYYLQLAAFAHFKDADNLKAKLLLQGYKPAVESKKVGEKTWYRVILGPFNNKQAAEKANKQLKKKGFHGLINQHSATT